MTFKRPITLASGAAIVLALSGFALSSGSSAAELVGNTPLLAYDLSATIPASMPAVTPVQARFADDSAEPAPQTAPVTVAAVDPADVECMAKVVMHEANNQPREGKIAVAQTLVNRLKAGNGRFGDSICEIVNQKGQYFRIGSFRPRRDSDGWQDAVEVAHQVLAGQTEPVAPGAMYFRASYAPANAFFRTRQRVTTVGAHVFYR
jgi:spore germination cell wall hydrolase CwlJ-like protein